jgi:hypothetical protein
MTLGRFTYGIVEGETPPVLHRLGTISDRSCCGKTIAVRRDGQTSRLVVCRRCIALDETRRAGMPDWF